MAGYAWRAEPFPPGEVQFPCTLDPHYSHYSKAAITHNIAADTLEKVVLPPNLWAIAVVAGGEERRPSSLRSSGQAA